MRRAEEGARSGVKRHTPPDGRSAATEERRPTRLPPLRGLLTFVHLGTISLTNGLVADWMTATRGARGGMARIVFIGAGSVEFTRNLLGDILTFPELAESEIVLHDIDAGTARDGRGDGALDQRRGRRPRPYRESPRSPPRPRGRRLRHQHHRGRRHRRDAARLRHPGEVRAAPDDRRHLGRRRRLPRPAQHPGLPRHRPRHGRALPAGLAPQLHQPDGHELLGLLRRLAAQAHRRPLPLDPEHVAADRRVRRRAAARR